MRIAIYGKKFPDDASDYVQGLFDELKANQVDLCINSSFAEFLAERVQLPEGFNLYTPPVKEELPVDFLITIGGDGTILDTITSVANSRLPIVGFNTGRLGFLANNPKEEAKNLVKNLVQGNFSIEERMLLNLETKDRLFGDNNFALNELTVHKKDSSSMMTIHTYVNDEYLNSYWADGLIVATPTGSTAYSLSCGGPIIIPQSRNFVINPIAPHNLSARPIIVPDDVKLTLKIEGRDEEFLATLDSRSKSISNETELVISKCDLTVKLVQFEGQNFYKTIRNKLLWGIDKRN